MKIESMEVIHPVLIDGHSRTGLGVVEFVMTYDEASGFILVESKRGTKRLIPLTNVKQVVPLTAAAAATKKERP